MQDIPASHVSIWLEGSALCIALPNSHTVMLPLGKWKDGPEGTRLNIGFEIFLDILRQRATAPGPIGTPAAPVQYDLDKMVEAYTGKVKTGKGKDKYSKGQRDSARAVLKKLGLT